MFNLILTVYTITLISCMVFFSIIDIEEENFFKKIFSSLEYKIFYGIVSFITFVCILPLLYLWGVGLIEGDPKAYSLLAFIIIPLIVGFTLGHCVKNDPNKKILVDN